MLVLHFDPDVKSDAKKLTFDKLKVAVRKAFTEDPEMQKIREKSKRSGNAYNAEAEGEYDEWNEEPTGWIDYDTEGYGFWTDGAEWEYTEESNAYFFGKGKGGSRNKKGKGMPYYPTKGKGGKKGKKGKGGKDKSKSQGKGWFNYWTDESYAQEDWSYEEETREEEGQSEETGQHSGLHRSLSRNFLNAPVSSRS